MKRLVLVLIVLAVTSLSYAGMVIVGPHTINLGSTITLEIIPDISPMPPIGFAGTVTVNPATGNSPADALGNVITTPTPPILPPYHGLPDYFNFVLPPVIGIPDTPKVTFDLTSVGTPFDGIIVLELKDQFGNPLMEHYVKVVPEPCSIALLSLGGLMLARLRR